MQYTRTTLTKSGATAVQVVRYINRKTVVVKHIGSSKQDVEIQLLKDAAKRYRIDNDPQMSLIPKKKVSSSQPSVIVVDKSDLEAVHLTLSYQVLRALCCRLGFEKLITSNSDSDHSLLLNLVIARILHPSSKLASLQFLKEELGIHVPSRTTMYRLLPRWHCLKDQIEQIVVQFAKKHLKLTFRLIFYDVTTLYYESFISDEELKQIGFSKDHKFGQPQVVLGLVVNHEGFPVSYQLFPGNTFEGHTFIPVIETLRKTHAITTMTVVADAAMLSQDNIDELVTYNLHYIVGARIGNLSTITLQTIDETLSRTDGATIRLQTPQGTLICSWSKKRYTKDKYETEKQIKKAQEIVNDPGKNKKRLKFVTTKISIPKLNHKLIEKTKMLWGVKGYYTNLKSVANQTIIDQYKNLWQVEKSFRIAKSDLQSRPIFHYKTESIKTHILICFMALALSKYIEIATGVSIKRAINTLTTVKDAKVRNTLTGEVVTFRSSYSGSVKKLLDKLDLSY